MTKVVVDSLFIRQLQNDLTYLREFVKHHVDKRQSKWMSEELVCEELGWSVKHLRETNTEKKLFTTRKPGKHFQYYREDVERYLESQIVTVGKNSNIILKFKQA